MNPKIESASVKVMRSHDYCHFEVCLSSSEATTPEQVDELRKTAARLADKAVEQYKSAKRNAEEMGGDVWRLQRLRDMAAQAQDVPEAERTPKQKAQIKTLADRAHFNRPRYNYQDDWQEPNFEDPEDNEVTF